MTAFDNSTILITGGASGIGLALSRRLAARGCTVIICGRNREALAKARALEPRLVTRVTDVTSPQSRQELVAWLNAEHPDLTVLINNAGVQRRRDMVADPVQQDLELEVETNFTAPVRLITALLPVLSKRSDATIVNVTSALAFSPIADIPVYCATKAALHSFTLTLRHQLKPTGIRVVEMAPPAVDTGLGGQNRSGEARDDRMLDIDSFADQALAQLDQGRDEVLVGLATVLRDQGEAMFDRLNGSRAH